MKKVSTILVVVFIIAMLPTSALAAGITSFTLSGTGDSDGWTTAVQVTNPNLVAALNTLIDGGAKAGDDVTTGAEQLAKIECTGTGQAGTYTVYRSGEAIYLSANGANYQVDAQAFYDLASSVDGFYPYRPIPKAKLSATTNAAVAESTYSFRKLDDVFYTTQFTKEAAPTIRATGDSLILPEITPAPSGVTVKVSQDNTSVFSGTLEEAKAYRYSSDGTLLVQVEANFQSDSYKGKVTYQYYLNYGAANITFSAEGSNTYPGELVVLRAQGVPAGESITATTNLGFTPKFYDDGNGGKVAMLPVNYSNGTGQYYVDISVAGQSQRLAVTANGKTFQVQHLTVSESTTQETIASQQANNEFNQKFLPLRWDDDAVQHWEGRFVMPVQGARVTTQFGAIRYTNGAATSSRHGGIDWACPTGTPVSATNTGRVVYAGYLQLTGYTVLIEHGYGLKSWYYHMNAIDVQTGQMVTKGQKIGEVGTTGFSTGPHLHFAISVNDVFVNHETLMNTDLVTGS